MWKLFWLNVTMILLLLLSSWFGCGNSFLCLTFHLYLFFFFRPELKKAEKERDVLHTLESALMWESVHTHSSSCSRQTPLTLGNFNRREHPILYLPEAVCDKEKHISVRRWLLPYLLQISISRKSPDHSATTTPTVLHTVTVEHLDSGFWVVIHICTSLYVFTFVNERLGHFFKCAWPLL